MEGRGRGRRWVWLGWGGGMGRKGRQLYLKNNKIIKKFEKLFNGIFKCNLTEDEWHIVVHIYHRSW